MQSLLDWLLETIANAHHEETLDYLVKCFAADLKDGHFQNPPDRVLVRWAIRERRYFIRSALTPGIDPAKTRSAEQGMDPPAWLPGWGPVPKERDDASVKPQEG
jgi:hypothetical protein